MKKYGKYIVMLVLALVLVACSNNTTSDEAGSQETTSEASFAGEVFNVGVVSDTNRDIWENVGERLSEKHGITLDIFNFSDYTNPNIAVSEDELDANLFQYLPFLADFNQNAETDLVPVAYTFVTPMGIWGIEGINTVEDVPNGASVSITNDPVNIGYGLVQMELAGLIEVDDAAGYAPQLEDITENPYNLEIIPMDTGQVLRALGDVDLAVTSISKAVDAGLTGEEALYLEDASQTPDDYKLTIAVKREDVGSSLLEVVLNEYLSEETATYAEEVTSGVYVPAWSSDDTPVEDYDAYVEENY